MNPNQDLNDSTVGKPTVQSKEYWLHAECRHLDADQRWDMATIQAQLLHFKDWSLELSASGEVQGIKRRWQFKGFDQVRHALDTLCQLADEQDHHPDAQFSYSFLEVRWSTHSAGGLSNNDWICAARLEFALKGLVD